MTTFNVVILDAYKPSRYRISKDTCGGYGTENDFGYGFIPNILSFVAKHSLFWSPLAVLNLISEFKNNNLFHTAYISNPEYILSTKSLLDGDTYGYILSKNESIDIDDMHDFRFAEYMYLNENKFDVDKK